MRRQFVSRGSTLGKLLTDLLSDPYNTIGRTIASPETRRTSLHSMVRGRNRVVVVSNRLPFVFHKDPDGSWRVEPGSGGLVSALLPVLRHRGGTWIGWPGTPGRSEELERTLAQTSE